MRTRYIIFKLIGIMDVANLVTCNHDADHYVMERVDIQGNEEGFERKYQAMEALGTHMRALRENEKYIILETIDLP